jgi:ligand-binding sensor domain-containing protein/DNA-binding CsgD family transcriptional regulator
MVLARALLPCALLAQLVAHLFAPAAAHALDPALPLARYAAEVLAPAIDGVTVGVRAITQSRDGFLWLATSGGLLRFDGLTFRAPIGRPGLQSDPTLSDVLEDPAGGLWLASDGAGGVGRWRDGDLPAPIEGLPHSFVRELLLARDGALWIATAGGVARREGAALVSFDTDDGLPAVNSRALGEDARGGIWVATTSGVARFDGTRFTPAGPGHAARALLVDRAGDVWVGTQGHGLERLRAGAWTSLGRAEGLPSLTVRTLLEDRAGSLWIGTEAGLVCHRGDALLAFPEGHPAASAPIDELFEDPSGGLWIALGRKGGLVRLRDPAFATLDARAGLPSDDVGAHGYVLKGTKYAELVAVIEDVVLRRMRRVPPDLVDRALGASYDPELTPRERDILALLATGHTNQQIATKLAIAETTVKNHVTNVLSKLGVTTRTQATVVALQRGLVTLE